MQSRAFEGRFESIAPRSRTPPARRLRRPATAAHDVLVARFPLQAGTLDTLLTDYLNGLGLMGDEGMAIGHQAAANILNLRAGDGIFPNPSPDFAGDTDHRDWRPTPPGLPTWRRHGWVPLLPSLLRRHTVPFAASTVLGQRQIRPRV